ncbi:YIP1 family protein [Roseisalinus antarcticus]|uniref:Yip1 domain protein n=1 Tax=Roseisalinus antarcticus TaxID=254357 RepID=A0A1Y5TJ29_9RHOB|nr:YIP1 family protein [Roseisalinus antarcticus]SLN65500.1 Yip1 domain protein [Roseisalinus antarcticus]
MAMTPEGEVLARLLRDTVTQPAQVARLILGRKLPTDALWTGLVLVTVLSVLMVAIMGALVPSSPEAMAATVRITPFTYAVILGGSLVITIFALHFTGQMLGGQGALADTLALMVWLQVLLLVLQVAQLIVSLILPGLGSLVAIATLAVALWVLVNFINEAQRFGSLPRAALTLILALLGVGLGLSVLLGIIGASV